MQLSLMIDTESQNLVSKISSYHPILPYRCYKMTGIFLDEDGA